VGNYVCKSEDLEGIPTDHEWDRLTLKADGKYDLVQGGPTKAKSEKTGIWQYHGGDFAAVELDQSVYPVRVKGDEIRLLIDSDIDTWYSKSK
jgi:hypothetical protein